MTHTSGKWETKNLAHGTAIENETGSRICFLPKKWFSENRQPVGSIMVKNKTQEEIKSNALLIAAAPELLAACEWYLSEMEIGDEGQRDIETAENMMRAAIAKAKDHKRAKKRYWEANTENL